ncbi:PTS system mannose/fructose/sorbose family transporter subunit IID [Elusimicrobiota bacterium]
MKRRVQISVFARSLFVQAWWNFEGMQNIGFLFGLEPLLRGTYASREDYRDAAYRHLGFFNTNPYMAGFVLGAVGSMEERRAALPEEERASFERRIESVKKTASSVVAAMGDSFFWGALRPACAAAGILLAVVLWTIDVPYALVVGGVAYLALYNAPAIWLRWKGLSLGYSDPEALPAELRKLRWQEKARWVRGLGLASAVLLTGGALLVPPWGGALSWWNPLLLAAAIGLRAFRVSTLHLYGAAVILGAGTALVGF